MKNCRECGNDIDKELDKCPHCNAKQPPLIIEKKIGPVRILLSVILTVGIPMLAIYFLPIFFIGLDDKIEEKKADSQEEIKEEDKEILDSLDYVNKIDYDIFISFISTDYYEDRYIMIGNYSDLTTVEFLKMINRTIIDYEYQVYYLDISQLTSNQINEIKNKYISYKDIEQVPCLYFIKAYEEPIRINKDITFDEYKEFIQNNGVRRKVKR